VRWCAARSFDVCGSAFFRCINCTNNPICMGVVPDDLQALLAQVTVPLSEGDVKILTKRSKNFFVPKGLVYVVFQARLAGGLGRHPKNIGFKLERWVKIGSTLVNQLNSQWSLGGAGVMCGIVRFDKKNSLEAFMRRNTADAVIRIY
jgi:hypothetical protein